MLVELHVVYRGGVRKGKGVGGHTRAHTPAKERGGKRRLQREPAFFSPDKAVCHVTYMHSQRFTFSHVLARLFLVVAARLSPATMAGHGTLARRRPYFFFFSFSASKYFQLESSSCAKIPESKRKSRIDSLLTGQV